MCKTRRIFESYTGIYGEKSQRGIARLQPVFAEKELLEVPHRRNSRIGSTPDRQFAFTHQAHQVHASLGSSQFLLLRGLDVFSVSRLRLAGKKDLWRESVDAVGFAGNLVLGNYDFDPSHRNLTERFGELSDHQATACRST